MSISIVIMEGSTTITVVQVPASPGFRSVEFGFEDTVATVRSPFTGQVQVQQWPGADMWSATVTLPPMKQSQADQWITFLMECRGTANGFLLGDPMKATPAGNVAGTSATTYAAVAGAQAIALHVGGPTSITRWLAAGDYLQIGYRMYRSLTDVDTNANGDCTVAIWPSVRETIAPGVGVSVNNVQGLFRRANNKQIWSATIGGVTSLSFQAQEYR